ncbi:MAG TPA: hypothetical protein VKR22_01130, partial [Acidimicrobiales bacterium]|nr:hypothetical protein [Acidimicrobiales bacterium]
KAPLGERLRDSMLKPAPPDAVARTPSARASIDELEARVRYADDKERLIGLLAAPIAAMIGILVTNDLVAHDPPALLRNGHPNKLHVSVGLYHELELVVLGLALVMLASAFYRKRMLVGGAMALYGLAVFNLHYWGFGVPFVIGGAWYLVRAYRAQRELKEATAEGSSRPRPGVTPRPKGNKRYTPPA